LGYFDQKPKRKKGSRKTKMKEEKEDSNMSNRVLNGE